MVVINVVKLVSQLMESAEFTTLPRENELIRSSTRFRPALNRIACWNVESVSTACCRADHFLLKRVPQFVLTTRPFLCRRLLLSPIVTVGAVAVADRRCWCCCCRLLLRPLLPSPVIAAPVVAIAGRCCCLCSCRRLLLLLLPPIAHQILWPDGIFITKHPKRKVVTPVSSPSTHNDSQKNGQLTTEQELEAVRRAKFVYELFIEKAPAALVSLVGRKEYEQCAQDVYFFLQSPLCLRQLTFELLELLLLAVFPELDSIVRQCHEEKQQFGVFDNR